MRNFSPLAITYRAISDLAVAKRNPRTHSSTQIEQIARSIAAFGWTNPVLIDEDQRIIAGHGRLEAARKLGIAEVPTITLAGLDDAQKRALVIADNALALNAGWDSELLALELGELGAAGFDVSLVGFSDTEMDQILAPDLDPSGEWEGMPEFEQNDNLAFQKIIVHFKDQGAVDAFAALIDQRITRQTRFTWFPRIEIETYADKRYAPADEP